MSLTNLFFGKGPQKLIGSIEVDAFITETHSRTSELTSYPVEDGTDISDHIINNPIGLSVDGFISPAAVTLLQVTRQADRHIKSFEQINVLMDKKELVQVVTGLKVYDNMHIQSFVVNRNKTNGNALAFTMGLKQARTVTTQLTIIPNTQIGGDSVTELQAQAPADVGKTTSGQNLVSDIIEQAESIIDAGLGFIGG